MGPGGVVELLVPVGLELTPADEFVLPLKAAVRQTAGLRERTGGVAEERSGREPTFCLLQILVGRLALAEGGGSAARSAE